MSNAANASSTESGASDSDVFGTRYAEHRRALTQHIQRLPAGLMTTLTWDRGDELAHHRAFSIATGVRVYRY